MIFQSRSWNSARGKSFAFATKYARETKIFMTNWMQQKSALINTLLATKNFLPCSGHNWLFVNILCSGKINADLTLFASKGKNVARSKVDDQIAITASWELIEFIFSPLLPEFAVANVNWQFFYLLCYGQHKKIFVCWQMTYSSIKRATWVWLVIKV
jgi:hypothetical protein